MAKKRRSRSVRTRDPLAGVIALRSSPTQSDGARVDRKAGVIADVSIIQTGPAIGHGFDIDQTTLEQVAELGNAQSQGVKARLAHPNECDDCTGKELGRWRDFRVEGDRTLANLHVLDAARRSPAGNLADWVFDVADEDPGLIAVSIYGKGDPKPRMEADGTPRVDDDGERLPPVLRLDALVAADIVDEAAANRTGLFASAGIATELLDAAIDYEAGDRIYVDADVLATCAADSEQLVALAEHRNLDGHIHLDTRGDLERAANFLNRYLDRRGLNHAAITAGDVRRIVHRLQEPRTMPDKKPTAPDKAAATQQAPHTTLTSDPSPDVPATTQTAPATTRANNGTTNTPDNGTLSFAAAVQAENKRVRDIQALARMFPDVDLSKVVEECVSDTNISLSDAQTRVLQAIAPARRPVGSVDITVTQDSRDKLRVQTVDALLLNKGVTIDAEGDDLKRREREARQLRSLGPKQLSRIALREAGVPNVERMSDDEVFNRTFGRFTLSAVGHTTGDFPLILADAANKVMVSGFRLAPVTWDQWCKIGSNPDFKPKSVLRRSEFALLDPRVEGEPTKHGSFAESREQITVDTKDKGFSYTRKMYVNDDLGAFMDAAESMGGAANYTIEVDVYTDLTRNSLAGPTMGDSKALFHADHNNIYTGGAPSQAPIEAIAAGMMEQTGIGDDGASVAIGVAPQYWLARPTIAFAIEAIVTSNYRGSDARRDPQVQALKDTKVIPVPILAGLGATTQYYAAANQMLAPSYEVAFLNGQREPTLIEFNNPSVDGTTLIVRHDYDVHPTGGWQGIARETGT